MRYDAIFDCLMAVDREITAHCNFLFAPIALHPTLCSLLARCVLIAPRSPASRWIVSLSDAFEYRYTICEYSCPASPCLFPHRSLSQCHY